MKKITREELKKIEELHGIYSNEIPNFIKQIIKTQEMQRIKHIGQNCGRDYISDKLQSFEYNYSRLDHSVGVGLIVWNFTHDIKQTIAALLHDIATPTFSHVIDYYNNDEEKQTSTEHGTEKIIENSAEINKIISQYGIKTEEISNYAMYPIADNDAPGLSADRLEYNLYMGTARGLIDLNEAKEIYEDIIIVKNEKGLCEMCFQNLDIARKLTKIALENGKYMSGEISTITNKLLSDILKLAVNEKIITPEMFYRQDEEEMVNILERTNNLEVKRLWNKFRNFEKISISNSKIDNMYNVEAKSKKRYINPLIKDSNSIKRISDIDKKIGQEINEFIAQNDEVVYFSI